MRLYTGAFNAQPAAATATGAPVRAGPEKPRKYPAAFLEKRISGLSEYASVVTFATARAMLRAPEAKLIGSVTFLAVLMTILIQATTTRWLAKKLDLLVED